MGFNPSLLGMAQTMTCMSITISFPTATALTVSTTYSNNFPATSSPNKNLAIVTTLTMLALSSTNQVDNELWCPNPTAVTFPAANPFGAVTYEVGSAAATSTPAVSFTLSAPTGCTDLVFLYSAKLSSGAALPSFIGYSLTTNIFSWPTVTAA
jgi:hypothetical protein